jgi:hypothetical protein
MEEGEKYMTIKFKKFFEGKIFGNKSNYKV